MAYPVTVSVEPLIAQRNRLTTAFRIILAIPHILLVGGIGARRSAAALGSHSADTGEFLASLRFFSRLSAG